MSNNKKNSVRIKVCGLKQSNNLSAVAAAGADYVGMIFFPGSPRYAADTLPVGALPDLPGHIVKVGVFVNESTETIQRIAEAYRLQAVQLHGKETPEQCEALRGQGYQVLKVFGVGEDFDFSVLDPYLGKVDFFLFDTKTPDHGGSGISFNWSLLTQYPYDTPVFIGGGVSLENVTRLLAMELPFLHAIDMNSRLETEPGLKDIGKVKEAVRLVKTG